MKIRNKKKPNLATIRINAVLRYFLKNEKAKEIALNKPIELYAQEDTETIIEIIEGELERKENGT